MAMRHSVRAAIDPVDPFANNMGWSIDFHHRLLRVAQTPYRAPNANAHAERFVRSIKEGCLHRIVPLGERHFRHTVSEFVSHYHRERPHQGCGNALLEPRGLYQPQGRITRRPRLGGMLNFYERAA